MKRISRAILSVYDKNRIIELAGSLHEMGIEILSTGGTARLLMDNSIPVIPISEYTGYPEILDGRVKTLNPVIHGGILGRTSIERHRMEMEANNIKPIDMVVVNLYPFEVTISKEDVTFEEAMENIDIGGPTMLRAAAKNCEEVIAVVDPDDYVSIINEMRDNDGRIGRNTRLKLAGKVFAHISRYDAIIANYLEEIVTEKRERCKRFHHIRLERIQEMRYGENPHQSAGFYKDIALPPYGIAGAKQLHGKGLSFNNIIDLDTAYTAVNEFSFSAVVIVKHTNPCGVAVSDSLVDAYRKARETDPVSAFGSVIGFNREVDEETAGEVISTFVEAVIAPAYEEGALRILKTKKNLRVMKLSSKEMDNREYDLRRVSGGILIQEVDSIDLLEDRLNIVTERAPTPDEWEGLRFAWKVVKHVKSNAIVYATRDETVGIGAGQMSRVDSSRLAVMKANKPLKGTVMASDAFFPFRDSIDTAAEAGVTAIIQPGGSIRDKEVIGAADEYHLAMVFTGIRHFRH